MNETEERTGLDPRSVLPTVNGLEEEEPPGKPRRHPLWRDVPDHLWDDWRWQSQNAIRSVRLLRILMFFTPQELEAIGSPETEYKTAIPPVLLLADRSADPTDPDPSATGGVLSHAAGDFPENPASGWPSLKILLEEDKDVSGHRSDPTLP